MMRSGALMSTWLTHDLGDHVGTVGPDQFIELNAGLPDGLMVPSLTY